MATELIVIAGLPGSGKTTYMDSLRQEGWLIFDDFKANAYNHSSVFSHSRNYEALLKALQEGRKCVLADIDFCKARSRNQAEVTLRAEIPDIALTFQFFENDFDACHSNVIRRASKSIEDNLRTLREYHTEYQIPPGTQVFPVWRRMK